MTHPAASTGRNEAHSEGRDAGLGALALVLLILLGTSCAGTTSTNTAQPTASTRPSAAAALDPYRALVAAAWPAIDSSYTSAPCAKVDSKGMPIDRTGCKTDTLALKALAEKLAADLKGQTPPAGLTAADADLKAALSDLISSLDKSNQAIDTGDGPAFADAGGLVGAAYRSALRAKVAILK